MSLIFALAADLRREMMIDYHAALEVAITDAETVCNGYTVTRAGRSEGITTRDLFTGPERRAYRYATPELVDHWATYPRPTQAAFEAQWLHALGDDMALMGAWA